MTGQALGNALPVAFLFSGNGAQWAGMGRDAWNDNVHFREALKEIDGHFAKVQDWSIVDQLFDNSLAQKLRRASYAQPLLLALQIASVRALAEAGVTPMATLGHSVGEISAAWAAGALSLEQAIDIVVARSRHQESTHGAGGMAALMLSESETRRFLKMPSMRRASTWPPSTACAASRKRAPCRKSSGSWQPPTASASARVGSTSTILSTARSSTPFANRRLLRELDGLEAAAPATQDDLLGDRSGRHRRDAPGRRTLVATTSASRCNSAAALSRHAQGRRIQASSSRSAQNPSLRATCVTSMREAGVRGAIVETMSETDGKAGGDPIERARCRAS